MRYSNESQFTIHQDGKSTIITDTSLDAGNFVIKSASNQGFLERVIGEHRKMHHVSRSDVHFIDNSNEDGTEVTSKFFTTAHSVFDAHGLITLRPELLWYLITHEVSLFVKENHKLGAFIFGANADKKISIDVIDDSLIYGGDNDWASSIALVERPLREKLTPEAIDVFLPRFSTATAESDAALLVSLMDTVSQYVDLKWRTRCGIQKIRLEGTLVDWELLLHHTRKAQRTFEGLSNYFEDLIPVITEIVATLRDQKVDPSFWSSVYKVADMSGGPYTQGWLTSFLAYKNTEHGPKRLKKYDWHETLGNWGGFTTDEFPSHISKVNFTWNYIGTEIPMAFVGGVIGVDNEDGFLAPKLGIAVYERHK